MTPEPNLAAFVKALRVTHPLHPHIFPTADEAEVADLIEELDAIHVRDEKDPALCAGCAEQVPCKGRLHAEELGLLWTGRAHARYTAHMTARLGATPVLIPIDGGNASARPERPFRAPAVLPAETETEQARLRVLRSVAASSVYCRYPDCRALVTILHPLPDGYLHAAVCAAHADTTADRYPGDADWSAS